MRKKILSFALALVMCLGLTVPAFAAEEDWELEVPGKSSAESFVDKKTFILRDCGYFDFDPTTGDAVFYKDDDREWTAENLCVLAKGDTAVFTYRPEAPTGDAGWAWSTKTFYLIAWSDPDGDGVYDKRLIEYEYGFIEGENGHYDLLLEDREVLPAGIDVSNGSVNLGTYGMYWSFEFNAHEDGDEVRLSADRALELFGPNTLIWICEGIMWDSPNWAIFVEGNTTQSTVPTVGNFTDVKTSDYFAESVEWAVEKGITDGVGNNQFLPGRTCTNGEIITFLWRAAGEPQASVQAPITAKYAGFADAVNWAYEQGVIDASFQETADCTRANTVTYIWKAKGSPAASGSNGFTDVPANADYAQAVNWAVGAKITDGTGNGSTFSPANTCTRGEIVTFLYRAFAE